MCAQEGAQIYNCDTFFVLKIKMFCHENVLGFECRDPAEDSPMALKNQQMSSSERYFVLSNLHERFNEQILNLRSYKQYPN